MKKIILYSTSACPHCKTAKAFLMEKGYDFIEKNAQLDPAVAQEMRQMKMMGVPSFLIGDEVIVGFDPKRIEALLDYTVVPCPSCSRRARVPKGKGKVRITCKQCGHTYDIETEKM